MSPHPGRFAAVQTLSARQRGRVDLGHHDVSRLEPGDQRVARDLVLGVRRRLFLLDAILRRFLDKPVRAVPPRVREALRVGVHDLLFSDRTPAAVIVSETVDVIGSNRPLRALTNAVLRKIAGSFEIEQTDEHRPSRHTAWLSTGRRARFARPVLPDPGADPVKHLSMVHSLTESFVSSFMALLPVEHEALFRACSSRLPATLRPRPGYPVDVIRDAVEADGGRVVREVGGLLEIRVDGPIGALAVIREGQAVVQDLVASEAVGLLAPQPGDRVLDLCAPPGGKTVQIAEALQGRGEVVAAHSGVERIGHLQENLTRLGLQDAVHLHDLGRDGEHLPDGPFDRVLVDAPCSNTGVLMKRVEARYRVQDDELSRLETIQAALLARAASRVRPGGFLAYSTCSIVPGENHGLVRRFLAAHRGFRLVEERLRFPHRTGRDGGYVALLCLENGTSDRS